MTVSSVESRQHHLWTDALHGRELARRADNGWDRGTYVRWAVASAWAAFEDTCGALIGADPAGRFKDWLNKALGDRGSEVPEWGSGLYQQVDEVRRTRNRFAHSGLDDDGLFADVAVADHAIAVLRRAIHDMFERTGQPRALWPDDDDDRTPAPTGGLRLVAHVQVLRQGADKESGVSFAITDLEGIERVAEIVPADRWSTAFNEFCEQCSEPLLRIRALRGDEVLEDRRYHPRRSPSSDVSDATLGIGAGTAGGLSRPGGHRKRRPGPRGT